MGLDIGIIHITYLERPPGMAYKFAWEMAIEASTNGYMHGEGNNWALFTQRRALKMLEEFALEQKLADDVKEGIFQWLRSLPWIGWVDDLDIHKPIEDEDDYFPTIDGPDEEHGGFIELHINW